MHRLHNKGVYVKVGLRKVVNYKSSMCKELHKQIRLEMDGRSVELPPCEGIICLNIASWGSGANPWGSSSSADRVADDSLDASLGGQQWVRPTHYDGMLEIVAVSGIVHMVQIQSGIRSGESSSFARDYPCKLCTVLFAYS